MARFREPLSGGLVTSKPPDQLQPGECLQLDNLVYVPGSMSPRTPPSRTYKEAATSFTSPPTGLITANFDFVIFVGSTTAGSTTVDLEAGSLAGINTGLPVYGDTLQPGTTISAVGGSTITLSKTAAATGVGLIYATGSNYLVVQDPNDNKYKYARLGNTDVYSFSDLATITAGTYLETVHYADQFVLMNGAHPNIVMKSNLTTRSLGLQPVVGSPEATVSTTGGAWVLDTGVGFYSYWTTEVDKSHVLRHPDGTVTGEGIESTFEGKPTVVNILTTAYYISVKRPARVNTTATHWRLYRSTKMTSASLDQATEESVFPNGVLVGEAEMADDGTQDTIIDGQATYGSVANELPSSVDVNSGTPTWTNANNVFTEDAIYATLSPSLIAVGSYTMLRLGSFGITTANISPPVTGIVIKVKGKRTGGTLPLNNAFSVRPVIYRNGFPIAGSNFRTVAFTTTNTEYTIPTSGGTEIKTDLWGFSNLNATDFADGNFAVEIRCGRMNVTTIDLDCVKVTVYHNKGKQSSTLNPFPAINVNSFGLETAIGRDGPAPVSTTGDVFQDSLVLNDVRDPGTVRYSFPTRMDSWPRPYYLNFQTRDNDKITNIKTIGNVCVVGMARQLYRINYLPRETDSEFDRGRAIELIEGGHGIVGTKAACLVNLPNASQHLAYVSQYGVHVTDGYRSRMVSGDINWARLNTTSMSSCFLINNPSLFQLQMYYPQGASTPNKILCFSYHPSHIKENGNMKVSGPISYEALAGCTGSVSGSGGGTATKVYTAAVSNKIEVETSHTDTFDYQAGWVNDNLDNVIGVGGGGTLLAPAIKTRRMVLAGTGKEWRARTLHLGYSGDDGANELPTPINVYADVYRVGNDVESLSPKTMTTITASVPTMLSTKAIIDKLGEGMEFVIYHNATNSEAPMSYEYVMIEGDGFDDEETQ